jgi:dTDP-4-dehydrorhamnose reductase
MKVLVCGAGGQLGQAMVRRLSSVHDVIARTSAELDVTSTAEVTQAVRAVQPDAVINCAAYTNVDGAEVEPERALAVNAIGPRNLARAAREANATLVHFSTDFVFDGKAAAPYAETDAPRPEGVYAASKLLGEWFAAETGRTYVLRVESLFGGPRAKSSVDLLLNAIVTGAEARAFSDRTVSPSYVDDVVEASLALLERNRPAGLYHCVNTGMTTWLNLARELAALTGRHQARIIPIRMSDLTLKAPRPQFAALSNAKLTGEGISMPTWQDALRRYVETRLKGEKDLRNVLTDGQA